MESSHEPHSGFLETIKTKLNIKQFTDKIDSSMLLELAIYFGFGFVIGFLLSKFFKNIVIAVIVLGLILFALSYLGFVTINFTKLSDAIGIPHYTSIDKAMYCYYQCIKAHVWIAVSALIGFLFGLRIG